MSELNKGFIEGYDVIIENENLLSNNLYGSKLDKPKPSIIDKNSSTQKELYSKEKYKNKHYICQDCSSFPLINLIKNDKKFKLLLKCENHKEEIDLKTYVERIERISKNNKIDSYSYQFCKIHKNENYIFACLKCKMNLCSECNKSHNKEHKKQHIFKLENLKMKQKILLKY